MLLLLNYLVTLMKDTTDEKCLWAICISGTIFIVHSKRKLNLQVILLKWVLNMLYLATAVMRMIYKASVITLHLLFSFVEDFITS